MTTLREAAQQALEVLESGLLVSRHAQVVTALRAALAESERDWSLLEATQASLREHMAEIRRLRAALAQQAEPEEPVAWMVYTLDGKSVCVTDNPADFGEGHRALPLYTTPPQRKQAQRDALLEALQALVRNEGLDAYSYLDKGIGTATAAGQRWLNARAAIKAVEGAEKYWFIYYLVKFAQEQERERSIQFLQEMQRQVGDAHNHYGHAALRIKEQT